MQRAFYWTGNMLRDTGAAFDRAGLKLQGNLAYKEQLCRHRRLMPLYEAKPYLRKGAWVAPNATVIGNVSIGEKSAIWYGAVLRGDVNYIQIGSHTVIGDRSVVHVSSGHALPAAPTSVGDKVYIGQGVVLHACTIGDGARVEPNATVLDGATVGKNSVITAGSCVPAGKQIPEGELWGGNPARFLRKVTQEEVKENALFVDKTIEIASYHEAELDKTEEQREIERLQEDYPLKGLKREPTTPEKNFLENQVPQKL